MCDIILAPANSTAERFALFGKNSDRQRNEAQAVEYLHRACYPADAQVTCTYITIPQVQRTHSVLLCKPFWIWGAEMGANEHGVVIGNEGVHARSPAPQAPALTGMDLLRLALERASTAAEAVEVMTTLLERHGQGGSCDYLAPVYYNNSFVVADTAEAFVLETIGREWLIERVRGVRAASNRYSIGRGAQRVSKGLLALIHDSGWSSESVPDYAAVIADPHREHIGNAGARHECSTSLLRARDGRLGVKDMMNILRDHGSGNRHHPEWRAECTAIRTVCMHAGAEDRPGQTVGSMISELRHNDAVHWVTGTAAPCISIFKPLLMGAPLPSVGPRLTDRFDPRTLWWRHEWLHRAAILGDFARLLDDIRPERDALEASFETRVAEVLNGGGSAVERTRVVADCWEEAMRMEDRWCARMDAPSSFEATAHARGWVQMNRLADIDFFERRDRGETECK